LHYLDYSPSGGLTRRQGGGPPTGPPNRSPPDSRSGGSCLVMLRTRTRSGTRSWSSCLVGKITGQRGPSGVCGEWRMFRLDARTAGILGTRRLYCTPPLGVCQERPHSRPYRERRGLQGDKGKRGEGGTPAFSLPQGLVALSGFGAEFKLGSGLPHSYRVVTPLEAGKYLVRPKHERVILAVETGIHRPR